MGKKSTKKLVLNKNTMKQVKVKTNIKTGIILGGEDDSAARNTDNDICNSVARTAYNGTCTCPVAG